MKFFRGAFKNFNRSFFSNSQRSGLTTFALCTVPILFSSTNCKEHALLDRDLLVLLKRINHSTNESISNWSGTCKSLQLHSIRWEPKSNSELIDIMEFCNKNNRKCRPIGSALSPNGIGFPDALNGDVLSLSNFDKIEINAAKQTVKVGAGVTVESLLNDLKKHNLTLENFSSITSQQVAGWTQVAAHGTGITLSTVDNMIQSMSIAVFNTNNNQNIIIQDAPALPPKVITMDHLGQVIDASTGREVMISYPDNNKSRLENNKILFHMCKVGLGSLGVVTELEMKLKPMTVLKEDTVAFNIADYRAAMEQLKQGKIDQGSVLLQHHQRLVNNKHVRYMWFPYTDTLMSVTCNEVKQPSQAKLAPAMNGDTSKLVTLLQEFTRKPAAEYAAYSFAQLRCLLLNQLTPLKNVFQKDFIQQVNEAEAAYWTSCHQTSRIGNSNDILGFDCGGAQCVYEVCFPIGHIDDLKNSNISKKEHSFKDIDFVLKLLDLIESYGIAAPAPIEQRWTSSSTSYMSPAYSVDQGIVYCWVGIIMYLPTYSNPSRTDYAQYKVMHSFQQFISKCLHPLLVEYNATSHWGKVILPKQRLQSEKYMHCLDYYYAFMQDENAIRKCNKQQYNQLLSSETPSKPASQGEDATMYKQLQAKYPILHSDNLITYQYLVNLLDPNHICTNQLMEELLSMEKQA